MPIADSQNQIVVTFYQLRQIWALPRIWFRPAAGYLASRAQTRPLSGSRAADAAT